MPMFIPVSMNMLILLSRTVLPPSRPKRLRAVPPLLTVMELPWIASCGDPVPFTGSAKLAATAVKALVIVSLLISPLPPKLAMAIPLSVANPMLSIVLPLIKFPVLTSDSWTPRR